MISAMANAQHDEPRKLSSSSCHDTASLPSSCSQSTSSVGEGSCVEVDHSNTRCSSVAASASHEPGNCSRSRRGVRFDESRNVEYPDELRDVEDWDQTWYTTPEYAKFKFDERRAAQQVREERSQDENQDEDDAFDLCFSSVLEDIYDAAKQGTITRQQAVQMVQMYARKKHFIGLEYSAVRAIMLDADGRREFVQDVVAEVQDEMESSCGLADQEAAEDLRDSCLSITRPASLFAQFMARAQHRSCAIAAQNAAK